MTRLLACVLLACAAVFPAGAYNVSGSITSNQEWSGDVRVTGDVVVTRGVLSIAPGTRIVFGAGNDNPVYGDSSHIRLMVSDSGAIDARGYDGNEIIFTAAAGRPGGWGGIRFSRLKRDALNFLIHCRIEFAVDGIAVENPQGGTEPSSPSISYTTIRDCSRYGIYGNVGAAPLIQSVMIHDVRTGIFLHEPLNLSISEVYIYNVASGMVITGGSVAYPTITLNHLTVNNVSAQFDSLPVWWRGYALYCNSFGELKLNNSIIAGAEKGINLNTWEYQGSCNFWCVGSRPLPESLYDAGSMSCGYQPELFRDEDAGDLRLVPGARPENAACSGGSNMGAWQEWHDWPYEAGSVPVGMERLITPLPADALGAAPNPFSSGTVFTFGTLSSSGELTVCDRAGRTVYRIPVAAGSSSAGWDGRGSTGARLEPGMYVCRLQADGRITEKPVVIVR